MGPQNTTFVSLGWRCEVAWQIRQFYGQTEAYPFDWLVTPFDTLPLVIEEDFEAIADPQYLRVTQYGEAAGWSVENTRYRILLHHEFEHLPDGRIAPNWIERVPRVAAKYDYLRRRWTKLMGSAGQICFVRRAGCLAVPSERKLPTERAHYLRLFAALSKRAPQARALYMFCDCPNVPIAENVLDVAVGSAGPADWPHIEDRWKGRTTGYRDAFTRMLFPALTGQGGRRRFG